MKTVCLLLALGFFITNQTACSSEAKKSESPIYNESNPKLTIQVKNKTRQFTRTELLQSPYAVKLTIAQDPAYPGQKMVYMAVPVAGLFEGLRVEDSATMLFSCLDGFSAPILASRLLNVEPNGSIAYIAIEPADKKWPALKANDNKTAGPFYLVWHRPEKSNIATEEWPYQLTGFEAKPSFESQFPLTAPSSTLSEQGHIRTGYRAFQKNCFACHTLNGQGTSQIGPDLNIPFNPTEYMKPKFLKMLIRNPQDLRHWPQSKMAAVPSSVLEDTHLQDIILYLEHMAGRKQTP